MKSESIGTRGASQLRRDGSGQAGFTLLEALVSLAVILAFAAVLGPHLSQARRIMANADGRVAAQVLLRSLLDAPFDRSGAATTSRDGETAGLRWRVASEPFAAAPRATDRPNWQAYRVMASVAWGPDQVITAETIRLRRAPGR
jgi:prepilin-type N-terminal cleavage/methylation domain-containing protein